MEIRLLSEPYRSQLHKKKELKKKIERRQDATVDEEKLQWSKKKKLFSKDSLMKNDTLSVEFN